MAHLKEDPLGVGPAEAMGIRFAAALEADEESSALEVMRGKTAQEIIDTFYSSLSRPTILLANVDGWVFPDPIYEIFARGEQNDVPVIVGSTADDGTVVISRANVNQQAYQERAREKYEHLSMSSSPSILSAPTRKRGKPFWENTRDEGFTWGMRTWARTMKTVSSEAYLYFFSRVPPRPERETLGSYHTAEIPYVFKQCQRHGLDV